MINIIYEDKDIIVVEKKAGQLVQSGKSYEMDLTSEILNYRRRKKEEPYAAVINRLDRGVAGVVLFAKNKATAATLSEKMRKKSFCKQYLAIVCGKPEEPSGVFVDYLKKNEIENVSFIADADEEGAKRAELEYEVVGTIVDEVSCMEYSLVRINLITGRHHQIRVQFAARKMSLAGDTKYATIKIDNSGRVRELFGLKRGEIGLCATKLRIDDNEYSVTPKWANRF